MGTNKNLLSLAIGLEKGSLTRQKTISQALLHSGQAAGKNQPHPIQAR